MQKLHLKKNHLQRKIFVKVSLQVHLHLRLDQIKRKNGEMRKIFKKNSFKREMGCIPLVVKRKNCIKNHFCISRFNEIRPNYLELVPFNFEATSPFQIQQYKQNILVNHQNYQNVFFFKFNNLLFQSYFIEENSKSNDWSILF